MLFRIKGPAVAGLFEGEPQLVHRVQGCTVTAAVRGDLSSEKGYAKLLSMTCAVGNGKVIETPVKGYAAQTGKAGIRGPVVSREGDLVEKAFWSGVVGGIGDGVESQFQSTSQSAFGTVATSETNSAKDILQQGLGEGIGESSRMLSRYYIERAEQYQPVIPLAAGTRVELVFIEGTFLDGRTNQISTDNTAGSHFSNPST
jgi:conjugal transfer pilus assembly protein TraB